MSDLFEKVVYRPVGPAAWAKYVERAQQQAAGSSDDVEPQKIEPQQILDSLKVSICMKSLTRKEALQRIRRRDDVIDYASELTGLPREEIDLAKADFDHAAEIITRLQAVDILSCIVWDKCHGIEFGDEAPAWFGLDDDHWLATDDPAAWSEATDWFFSACLDLAWESNPQLALAGGHVPFA